MASVAGVGGALAGSKAAIVFRSIGHLFATFFSKAEAILPVIRGTEKTVETVSSLVPVYGPMALTVEKTAYAVLGELASVLNAADAATKAKLADAGLDVQVISTVEALLAAVPEVAALAKAL